MNLQTSGKSEASAAQINTSNSFFLFQELWTDPTFSGFHIFHLQTRYCNPFQQAEEHCLSLIKFNEQLCNPDMTFSTGTSCIIIYFPNVFAWLMGEKVSK